MRFRGALEGLSSSTKWFRVALEDPVVLQNRPGVLLGGLSSNTKWFRGGLEGLQ